MEKLGWMLLNHLDGILNYCRIKVPLGVVEAVNRNIKALLPRGRGYSDINYLLLKAQRLAATKIEFVDFQKVAENAPFHRFSSEPYFRPEPQGHLSCNGQTSDKRSVAIF
jgi:hypothetical protein